MLNFHSKYSKTRTIFNTWLVQMKFNMTTLCLDNHHKSFWQLINRSVQCVLSLFQNLVLKTDLVFVQPGAKLNSAYYCENILE